MSPPTLKALMLDLSLFKESLLKDPDEEVIFVLGVVYGQEAFKGSARTFKECDLFQDWNLGKQLLPSCFTVYTCCPLLEIENAAYELLYGKVV